LASTKVKPSEVLDIIGHLPGIVIWLLVSFDDYWHMLMNKREILRVIKRLDWREATSERYRLTPHQWCDGRRCDPADVQALLDAIQRAGTPEYYKGRRKRYLYPGDGRRYWQIKRGLNRMLIADLTVLPPEHRVYKSLSDWKLGVHPLGFD
jgi:hypothetical protein